MFIFISIISISSSDIGAMWMVKRDVLGPGVIVSIVLLWVPNSDFSTIQSVSTAVTSVGDFDRGN